MIDQHRKGIDIAAHAIHKSITAGDNDPGQPQLKIVDQVVKEAKVSRGQARYLVSVAVGKFNAVGLRALFEDFPE